MHIKDAVEWVLSKARTRDFKKETPTKHPGSKKSRARHKKKIRAAQKRAKLSRKRNRGK